MLSTQQCACKKLMQSDTPTNKDTLLKTVAVFDSIFYRVPADSMVPSGVHCDSTEKRLDCSPRACFAATAAFFHAMSDSVLAISCMNLFLC